MFDLVQRLLYASTKTSIDRRRINNGEDSTEAVLNKLQLQADTVMFKLQKNTANYFLSAPSRSHTNFDYTAS